MVISTLLTLLASTFTPAVLVTVAEASEIFLAIARKLPKEADGVGGAAGSSGGQRLGENDGGGPGNKLSGCCKN